MLQCVHTCLVCQVWRLLREGKKREAVLSQGSTCTFSSVHHCSHSLPISGGSVVQLSSSLLLLLPLFSLCSLSSNSIAIQELRCDPNAASSVIKRISSEDGSCHLNCLFWAHVTSNSLCVAPVFENIINSCLCCFFFFLLYNDPHNKLLHHLHLHWKQSTEISDTTRMLHGYICSTVHINHADSDIEIRIMLEVMPVGYANSEHHTDPLHTARTNSTKASK